MYGKENISFRSNFLNEDFDVFSRFEHNAMSIFHQKGILKNRAFLEKLWMSIRLK